MPNWEYTKVIRVGNRMQCDEDDPESWNAAVGINSCTARELAKQVPGIGPVLSNRIVEERKKHGLFRDWEDLERRVYGIGPKLIKKMKEHKVMMSKRIYMGLDPQTITRWKLFP